MAVSRRVNKSDKVTLELQKKIDNIDMVNKPPHYTFGEFQPIDVIEDWDLGYHLGNAIKYIARCTHKGTEEQDLKKAKWYLDRYIQENFGDDKKS